MIDIPLNDRDLSWLSFNHRVLRMAADPQVPLFERVRFLSIFSSNLDEFFRVRMPALMALHHIEEADTSLLPAVQETIREQLQEFGQILTGQLLPAMKAEGVHLYYGETIDAAHRKPVRDYFYNTVLGFLQPVIIELNKPVEMFLENNALYLVVCLSNGKHGIVNIPSANLPRFLRLPDKQIIFLDDVIREHLGFLFPHTTITGCYSIKVTRDAEIDVDEFSGHLLEKVENMLVKRQLGVPTRFLYDARMPGDLRDSLAEYFRIAHVELVAGGRYHNLKDLAELPMWSANATCTYPPMPAVPVAALEGEGSLLNVIKEKDVLLHVPYQQYDYIVRYFNEAATDPDVKEIYVTLYRVASGSQIVHALISAAKNGKQVTVMVELKARFDEANNIRWAKRMKEAGVKILYSIPGLKVHAKVALVKRKRGFQWDHIGLLATGNFNESTARFYTDHVLLTAHEGITQELELLFVYMQTGISPTRYNFMHFDNLLVAQFNLTNRFTAMIRREAENARKGLPAKIVIKLNNLQEKQMIAELYAAAEAGVEIDLIVRSICCIVPRKGIRLRRIVDRYLEHARIFIFHNNGEEEIYMGSADWMNRNLHRRIEVCFPVYDQVYRRQVRDIIDIQLADNTNAVILDAQIRNIPVERKENEPAVNAQKGIYAYVQQC
ncbi:polyphosphate kinase 1 [Chitinophaga sp. GCM10012297]|uniref:Polyphosphate kinase n=1 Tax=Chitinophaga chungangae TaxID=2821488 RepID=A0ABS3YCC3_9BACT|nr:polyphosphate kinase 1 [Chitinophaga chungangae]MBO9152322.1 polyphosphate kinase 1 [Chitinophaga chungangae]